MTGARDEPRFKSGGSIVVYKCGGEIETYNVLCDCPMRADKTTDKIARSLISPNTAKIGEGSL